ncbi:putative NBD/HSP70 family sugar kinase [Chelatococcus asaccharovorans]|uniref:Putative NBD/HSP70 family sugar kinase n=1 Tax=Chelatococcus asaccharovorans TaxID=28210 RepID=A0A2V3U6E3_9HYPH|nr:ROK family transcriptional regulator [Chelatococcus asaccharovorans]MBS7705649.1 ROK family transcriptional regulator [Chelatococcus asaccharovorans]PXW58667.1 putative NBD/HSP70 family sugar kinase [Chelatococcus asaccharovorans]
MLGRAAPRSRRQTRATVLENLLRTGGAFRSAIARETRLTEASVSRILAELRSENLVQETRHPAPYAGGPTSLVTLSNDVAVAGIELSNSRLSFGVGDLGGTLDYVDRMPASPQLDQDEFERLFRTSAAAMQAWTDKRGIAVRQVALSIPGYGREAGNPIYPWDVTRLRDFLGEALPGMPLALTNSVVAQAAFHRYSPSTSYPVAGNHLFLFVGHGVAGVIVNEAASIDAFSAFEIGHMVIERNGLLCRCGHRGCIEAYTSLRAISPIVGLDASEILNRGDSFIDVHGLDSDVRAALRERLVMLGLGLGNALNLHPLSSVVISGWPSLMPEDDRAAIIAGIDESLLGGFDERRLSLSFVAPSIGNDPRAALYYAAYCFVSGGGLDARADAHAALEEIA